MQGWRFNVLILFLIGVLFVLQYRLWFKSDGIKDAIQLKRILLHQEKENEALKKQNDALLFQIERLQHDHDAIESRARGELGMVKKGEKFYQIVK